MDHEQKNKIKKTKKKHGHLRAWFGCLDNLAAVFMDLKN